MASPSPRSHPVTLDLPSARRPSLQPYLSSATAGWEGLVAVAFHEPPEFEGLLQPEGPGVSLTLFTGGPFRMEWRQVHARRSWTGVTLRHGDLTLRSNKMVPYELRWRSLSSTPTHTFVLHLPQEALAHLAEDVAGGDPTHLRLIERACLHDPFLTQLALAIWRELQEGAPGGKLFAQCTSQLLALHLLRHYTARGDRTATTPFPHPLTARQVQRVIACIQDQPGQELTLEDLAQQTSFSPSHFARLFRRTTGESPHQYVLRQRLERARQLLEAGDAPVAQVAAESGFADQSHFTRVFKRFLGMTPRAYRQERRI